MSLIVKNQARELSLPPEGRHIARCFGVVDLGEQKNKNDGCYSPKVLIAWEFSNVLMENGKPLTWMQCYLAHLNKKYKLKALLEAWRGREFSSEELEGLDLESMLGEPCYLTMEHLISDDDGQECTAIFSDIALFSVESIPCPVLHNALLSFDLDNYTEESYLAVPENIRSKINLGNSVNNFY